MCPNMQGLPKNKIRCHKTAAKQTEKKIYLCFFPALEVLDCASDARALAEFAVLETDSSAENARWTFFWEKKFGAAVDVDVAACARIVIELADAAQLAAAGARDGDERGEDDVERLDVDMDVDLAEQLAGVLRQVVGRAVAVDELPGVLLELGGSR